jgi:hypothetical protein
MEGSINILVREWSVVAGAPGLILVLIVCVANAAWWLKSAIDKAQIEALRAKAEAAEERRLQAVELMERSKHDKQRLEDNLKRLEQQIAVGAPKEQLEITSASAAANMAHIQEWDTKVQENLGKSWLPLKVPHIDTDHLHPVKTEAELFELAASTQVVISHILLSLSAEVSEAAEELFAILKSLTDRYPLGLDPLAPPDELAVRRQIRDLLVRLKGNDILVYAEQHSKFLPERWEEPETRDPFQTEEQLIVALAPPSDYVQVKVDNGQPRTIREIPKFRPSGDGGN